MSASCPIVGCERSDEHKHCFVGPTPREAKLAKVVEISRALNRSLSQPLRNRTLFATRDVSDLCRELELLISQGELDLKEMAAKWDGILTTARAELAALSTEGE